MKPHFHFVFYIRNQLLEGNRTHTGCLESVLVLIQGFSCSPSPLSPWLLRETTRACSLGTPFIDRLLGVEYACPFHLALSSLIINSSQLQTAVSLWVEKSVSVVPSVWTLVGPLKSHPPRDGLWPPNVTWPISGIVGIWTRASRLPLPCTLHFALIWWIKFYVLFPCVMKGACILLCCVVWENFCFG